MICNTKTKKKAKKADVMYTLNPKSGYILWLLNNPVSQKLDCIRTGIANFKWF